MKRMLPSVFVLSLLSPAFAGDGVVGSGRVATETRQLAEFDEIEFRIAGDLHVVIGKPTPLQVEGDDNILPLIKTEVRDGRLVISAESSFKTKHDPEFRVTVANLKAVEIRGSGEMHVGELDNESLDLVVRGSGELHVEGKTERLAVSVRGSGDVLGSGLEAREVSVTINGSGDAEVSVTGAIDGDAMVTVAGSVDVAIHGSGDVRLEGETERLAVSINGSGDFQGSSLETHEASVSIHGSGDARVGVTDALNVVIHGSGDVLYSGNPKLSTVIRGSGDVKRRG